MKLRVLPYVSIEIDDRLRHRLRRVGDRFRVNVRAHLLSAADDVDTAVDRAIRRVDSVVAGVNDKIGPDSPVPEPGTPRLKVVRGQEAAS